MHKTVFCWPLGARTLSEGQIVRWENFLDAMSGTRLQDEYNEKVRQCDIFVSLFSTKAGKYTDEEFDVAFGAFIRTGRPQVYTFFKKTPTDTLTVNREAQTLLWDFQDKLKALGHYSIEFDGIEHLKRQFSDQLQMLRNDGVLFPQ